MSPNLWFVSGSCEKSSSVQNAVSLSGWQIIFPLINPVSPLQMCLLYTLWDPLLRFLGFGPLPTTMLTTSFARHFLEDREIFVWGQRKRLDLQSEINSLPSGHRHVLFCLSLTAIIYRTSSSSQIKEKHSENNICLKEIVATEADT